jgi:hypothetical protein
MAFADLDVGYGEGARLHGCLPVRSRKLSTDALHRLPPTEPIGRVPVRYSEVGSPHPPVEAILVMWALNPPYPPDLS